MTATEVVKTLIRFSGKQSKEIGTEVFQMSPHSWYEKVRHGSFTFDEIITLANFLGYDIEVKGDNFNIKIN